MARNSGPAGWRVSRSMRTTCWELPRTRVLREVRRSRSAKRPAASTPSRAISWRRSCPGWSSPTSPRTSTRAPRATRLLTTLPAPPKVRVSRSTSTTTTGASGEMRSTRPQRYSSSMKSPATRTRRVEKPLRSRFCRVSWKLRPSPVPWNFSWGIASSFMLPGRFENRPYASPQPICC